MEEENFASLNSEIVCETSGTSVTPQLVQVLPGKCGVGVVFVIKIANVYFETCTTDCDPKIGKNFFNACQQFDELGLPVHIPFVPCEYE